MAYLDENGLEYFWGKIKDRVSSAVAPKANDADVVHKTGDETVEGVKTFSNTHTYNNGTKSSNISIQDPEIVKGTAPEAKHYSSLVFTDSEGGVFDREDRLAVIEYQAPSASRPNSEITLAAYSFVPSSDSESGKWVGLATGFDGNLVPFATAPETSDDRDNSKDIITRGYMEASEWNWQKTKKNALVQFKPVPESDLEPVVDFIFTETPPAEGEKGPDNPSTITGTSSINAIRCGKNLVPYPYSYDTRTINGVSFTVNSDGSILINGTATDNAVFYLNNNVKKAIYFPGVTYTFSGVPSTAASGISFNIDFSSFEESPHYKITKKHRVGSFTVDEIMYGIQYIVVNTSNTAQNLLVYPQIEASVSSSSYEKPVYDRYTIQLGDTYYGGSLDVATGAMTVTWAGETIPNFEAVVDKYTNTISFVSYTAKGHLGSSFSVGRLTCDSFVTEASNSDNEHCRFSGDSTQARYATYFFISKSRLDVSGAVDPSSPTDAEWLAAANAWLASNPVFVCYQLFASETVQLTPTQIRSLPALDKYEPRINTVYTDQEAVQVGYQRYVAEDNLVHRTGNETINGDKNFTSTIVATSSQSTKFLSKHAGIERGVLDANHYEMPFLACDKNNNRLCGLYEEYLLSGMHTLSLLVYDSTSLANNYCALKVGFDEAGKAYAFAPSTLLSRNNALDVVTRSYVLINDVYVDAVNGDDSNEGTSASNAFKTIGTALGKVSYRHRCTINIAAGTYTENITITESSYFIFKLYGNVVINGNLVVTRNSGLHISPNNSAYTFTAKSLIVSYASFLYSYAKFITTYSGVSCYDESEAVFNYGADITVNTGNSQYGLYANVESYIYVNKELSIQAGSVSGSNVNNALFAYKNSCILVNNTTTNITCAGPVIASDLQSTIYIRNDSYSDSNNTFTATTSTRNAIYAIGGYIRTDNIKINITQTRNENSSSNAVINLTDISTFRLSNSQLNLICTGKAWAFMSVLYNSTFIFGGSNSLTFNGAVYAYTINCQASGSVFISSATTVSGTVTGGARFYADRGGQINIQGHSAGINRIPGASAGVVVSSSYGYYG